MSEGRFFSDLPRTGFENMAIDETLVESLLNKLSVPTFRLYSWNPSCLSLGFHQPVSEVNLENLQKKKLDLVRRPTGGRAVFHANEITYSAAIPLQNQSASFWYDKIHKAFFDVFRQMNIPVEISTATDNFKAIYKNSTSVPCFVSSAKSELLIEGKKVVGSAQRVFGSVLLQHGSILIDHSHEEIIEFLNFSDSEEKEKMKQTLLEKSVTLHDYDANFSVALFAEKLIPALNKQLNIQFSEGNLLPQELEMVYHFSKKYRRVS